MRALLVTTGRERTKRESRQFSIQKLRRETLSDREDNTHADAELKKLLS